ncbi:MAG TPA: ABC transporter ATP-binding protein [Acidimicrobiales bacterium]
MDTDTPSRRPDPTPAAGTLPSDRSVPVLEACAVDVDFGSVRALSGASISIAEGEWVAITGPSGSGKSTLLQLFAALDRPTRGTVRFRGADLAGHVRLDRYRRTQIGLVFQLHNLLPHLDAVRNVEVAMFGTRVGARERRLRALELLDLVELADQAGRRPPELSGGERQRVAIARALANDPGVVLADEPTGSLDPASVDNVMDVLARLHRDEATTIVMVTHDLEVAGAADRVVHCESGRLIENERQGAP